MAKQKNKKIFFEYMQIDSVCYENNIVRISKNFPKYDKFKELYLYELFYYDFLENKIRKMLSSNFRDCQFYDSFLIELTHDEFNNIECLFDTESDFNTAKKNDETNRMLFFLNASVKMAQNDCKFWNID